MNFFLSTDILNSKIPVNQNVKNKQKRKEKKTTTTKTRKIYLKPLHL